MCNEIKIFNGSVVSLEACYGSKIYANNVVASGTNAASDSSVVYSQNDGKTSKNNIITFSSGTVTTEANEDGSIDWVIAPILGDESDVATIYNPFRLSVAKVKCKANRLFTINAWVTKSHATNVGCRFICDGYQIAGVTSDVIATAASNTDRQCLSISITPTVSDIVEFFIETWMGTGTEATVTLDSVKISMA